MEQNPLHPKAIPLLGSASYHSWARKGPHSLPARLYSLNHRRAQDPNKPVSEFVLSTSDPYQATLATTPSVLLHDHIRAEVIEVDPSILEFYARLHRHGIPFRIAIGAASSPTGLCVHPTTEYAITLLKEPSPPFKRAEARPVMIVATGLLDVLFGFKSAADIVNELARVPEFADAVGRPETDKFVHDVKTRRVSPKAIPDIIHSMMSKTSEFIGDCLARLIKRLVKMPPNAVTANDTKLIELAERFPLDPMCFAVYFLNRVKMEPGNAVFVHVQEPYCILSGDYIECSSSGDAVIYGGLIENQIQTDYFLQSLSFDDSPVEVSDGERFSDVGVSYVPPVPEFQLMEFNLPSGVSQQMVETIAPSIVVVLAGEGYIKIAEQDYLMPLAVGSVYYLTPQTQFIVTSQKAIETGLRFLQIGVNESAAIPASGSCAIM